MLSTPPIQRFWSVQHFCVHQMLSRDGMHATDLGAILRLIMAAHGHTPEILRVCQKILDMEGLAAMAASRLEARIRWCLA
jgi:hypothetical protein